MAGQAKTMDAAWRSYAECVLPATAGATQRLECRRAFYAGAQAFLGIICGIDDDAELPALHKELDAFAAAVGRGEA